MGLNFSNEFLENFVRATQRLVKSCKLMCSKLGGILKLICCNLGTHLTLLRRLMLRSGRTREWWTRWLLISPTHPPTRIQPTLTPPPTLGNPPFPPHSSHYPQFPDLGYPSPPTHYHHYHYHQQSHQLVLWRSYNTGRLSLSLSTTIGGPGVSGRGRQRPPRTGPVVRVNVASSS